MLHQLLAIFLLSSRALAETITVASYNGTGCSADSLLNVVQLTMDTCPQDIPSIPSGCFSNNGTSGEGSCSSSDRIPSSIATKLKGQILKVELCNLNATGGTSATANFNTTLLSMFQMFKVIYFPVDQAVKTGIARKNDQGAVEVKTTGNEYQALNSNCVNYVKTAVVEASSLSAAARLGNSASWFIMALGIALIL